MLSAIGCHADIGWPHCAVNAELLGDVKCSIHLAPTNFI